MAATPMRRTKLTLALGAFFVLGAGLSACGGGVPGDSVADVAGNPVTTQAFNHWLFVAAKGNSAQSPGAPVIVPNDPPDFKSCIEQARKQIPTLAKTPDKQLKGDCGQLFTSLGSQVMQFLITAYWYQAEAAKEHVKISDAEVQQAFQTAKKQQFPTDAAFQSFLAQSGQTMQDILFRVRINELLKKLLAKHPNTVTPAAIQAYYNSHTSQFGTPESRDVRIVRTNTAQQAAAAKAALDSGTNWQQVAKQYSVDTATKNKGGLLTGVTRGQQEQALDKAAFSATQNKVLGPIHGTFGYYVFEVTKIKPSTQQTLAQATPLIKQILQSQTQTSSQSALDAQVKKNWLHQTQCRSNYVITANCSGYKPPKSTGTSAPGTAAPSQQSAPTTTSP